MEINIVAEQPKTKLVGFDNGYSILYVEKPTTLTKKVYHYGRLENVIVAPKSKSKSKMLSDENNLAVGQDRRIELLNNKLVPLIQITSLDKEVISKCVEKLNGNDFVTKISNRTYSFQDNITEYTTLTAWQNIAVGDIVDLVDLYNDYQEVGLLHNLEEVTDWKDVTISGIVDVGLDKIPSWLYFLVHGYSVGTAIAYKLEDDDDDEYGDEDGE